MKKQLRIPLVLFLVGMVITISGALFKIMLFPSGNIALIIGMLAEAIALILLITYVLKNMK